MREPNLAATRLRSNLVACNKHYAAIRKGRHPSHKSTNVLDRLHKSFSNLNDHFKVLEETIKKKPPQDPEEYPQSVNGRLYRTLRQNLQCRCTQPCVDSHQHTRLCLSPEVQIRGQDIVFDFLFSNDVKSALAAFRWQQVRLFVSK